MKRIGITGQNGFVGQHLYNTIGLDPNKYQRIEFERRYFDDENLLNAFVSKCDVIVHLAGMNRHKDPDILFSTNVDLSRKLIDALVATDSAAHVLFSSSTQEEQDNLYGKSKKTAREMFSAWAKQSKGSFTGIIIPNVFGPFGVPFYNSFIATFCYQLINGYTPSVIHDSEVELIYVGKLVDNILDIINSENYQDLHVMESTDKKPVSEVLSLLKEFKRDYFDLGIIPKLDNAYQINLFNTFRSFINLETHYPVLYTQHTDSRGAFVEIIRLNVGGQISFSTTVPGVTRGNHFHTRKIERFSVIKGNALIQLRKIGTHDIINYNLSGDVPAFVDMPIWYTHNIKNVGDDELYTMFWINEFFDPNDQDTFFENV
jgi:UDP-2-acetamido-2,6-beta-L-arabino-hexul-4-ose reductase